MNKPVLFISSFLIAILLSACAQSAPTTLPNGDYTPTSGITPQQEKTATFTKTAEIVNEQEAPTATSTRPAPPTQTPKIEEEEESLSQASYNDLPPSELWEQWPELPVLSEEAITIYKTGIQNGTDPHAFSIFGDCQSEPDDFWGRYDDPAYELPAQYTDHQPVVDWYSGSFDRESVTVRGGTTAAAVLWAGWLDGEDHPCEFGETPLQCELRIHNPSIVIISLGTHWELRNGQYLRRVLDELITAGVLPVISTKADQREGEAWVNEEMVTIAQEYRLPVWNFWAAVQSLENQGMLEGDPMYMNEAGLEMQRISGLKMLDTLWKELQPNE